MSLVIPTLSGLIERFVRTRATTDALVVPFTAAVQTFAQQRYTGKVLIHFSEGHPTALELLEPQRVHLTAPHA